MENSTYVQHKFETIINLATDSNLREPKLDKIYFWAFILKNKSV